MPLLLSAGTLIGRKDGLTERFSWLMEMHLINVKFFNHYISVNFVVMQCCTHQTISNLLISRYEYGLVTEPLQFAKTYLELKFGKKVFLTTFNIMSG